jgi:arylsulfatase A
MTSQRVRNQLPRSGFRENLHMIKFLPAPLAALFLLVMQGPSSAAEAARPNIVFILADDLGYGDVKCLNPQGKIATPHLDRLAAGGMIFTDAHSSSAVCSPTRYGILTGRYNWRSKLKSFVLGGLSPRLIEPDRMTVASFLHQHGYTTGCIGKWHLGMDWVKFPGKTVAELNIESAEQVHSVDYTQPIANGPTSVGFDFYFGISASLDMVPYTFIVNDRVQANPTEEKNFPLMVDRADNGTRVGPAAPGFEVENVLPALTKRAAEFIGECASDAKRGKPFFLYLPLNAPHTPIAPTAEWRGKSGLNPYADFVMQTDATVGTVLDALEKAGVAENTLVIFTSDNGCSPQAKFDELLAKGHNPSYEFRGTKADIFDGGHHVPFIARWPARVKAGSRSDQIVCLTDFFSTAAAIFGEKLPDNAAEDSVSLLPALEGKADRPLREAIVHHSINGSFAIRQANWKLELCPDSGGWSAPKPNTKAAKDLPPVQLYDLTSDIGETKNVQADHPEIVARLTELLKKYVADGRSTPGAPQQNTTPVSLRPKAGAVNAKGKAAAGE